MKNKGCLLYKKRTLVVLYQLFFACVLGLILNPETMAQNFREDLNHMGSTYASYPRLGVEVATEVYYHNQSKADNVYKGTIQKKEGEYYYRMQDTEMLINKDLLIMVNNKLHNIVYRPMGKEESTLLIKKYDQLKLDSLSLQYDSVSYLGTKDGVKGYELYSKKSTIERTQLFINASNGLLQRLVYFYAPKNDLYKVTILFTYQFKEFNDSVLLASNFLIKEGRGYKPQARFSTYSVNKFDPSK